MSSVLIEKDRMTVIRKNDHFKLLYLVIVRLWKDRSLERLYKLRGVSRDG